MRWLKMQSVKEEAANSRNDRRELVSASWNIGESDGESTPPD